MTKQFIRALRSTIVFVNYFVWYQLPIPTSKAASYVTLWTRGGRWELKNPPPQPFFSPQRSHSYFLALSWCTVRLVVVKLSAIPRFFLDLSLIFYHTYPLFLNKFIPYPIFPRLPVPVFVAWWCSPSSYCHLCRL